MIAPLDSARAVVMRYPLIYSMAFRTITEAILVSATLWKPNTIRSKIASKTCV